MQLLAKFNKIRQMGLRATLNFRKYKVALNPMCRIFLNSAKSCISSCLSKFCNKKKFRRAVFEISALKDEIKGVFSRSQCCYGNLQSHENNTKINNRVFLSRNYRFIVAPQKLDVLKTNICPRSASFEGKYARGEFCHDSQKYRLTTLVQT